MNKWLKGNGYWCTACNGTGRGVRNGGRLEYTNGVYLDLYHQCTVCGGDKRIAADATDIISGSVIGNAVAAPTTFMSQCIVYGRDA